LPESRDRLGSTRFSFPGVPVLQPNQLFADRYRIVKPLAEGGMGAVFVAQHTATEALVALKVLWPHVMQSERARQSFELEAKVAARVKSEHIVRVFDAGLDGATRSPFLVMELLEGVTLAEKVWRNGPRPWREVTDWIGQTARGLDAAHGHRNANGVAEPIVHRDLKPENLFLSAGGQGTTLVKILDFGIAKVLGESIHPSREVRGTPAYMASEQVAGEEISPRTDIWALGLIAYFLVTGRCYWRSVDRMQALFAEILTLPLPAPSERAREEAPAIELPAGFDGWLLRCIDRDPDRRFASAGEAAQALSALQPPVNVASPIEGEPKDTGIVPDVSPTETVNEGLRISIPTVGSVPSLTTGVPATVPVTHAPAKHKRTPLWSALVVLLVLGSVGLWIGIETREKPSQPVAASTTWSSPAPSVAPIVSAPASLDPVAPVSALPSASIVAPSARPSSQRRTDARRASPSRESSGTSPKPAPIFVELPPESEPAPRR
jgi:eukaryotic-like serine/threonine-protein kinase